VLVEQYGLDRRHRGIRRAAQFVFGCQTADGDIRGIYGTQLSPTYTAGLLELLVKAGFGNTPAARRAFRWLPSVRQDDGGWAIPMRTVDRLCRLICKILHELIDSR
jgi:hypothetical protein